MKKLLLIVSSHEDAGLLPEAAKVIDKLGCQQVWVWHSPILAVDPEKECSVIDAEIAALTAGEKQAAGVGDYETAKSRKAEREKLLLNRSVEIRNAWKRVSEEGRKASIGRYMEPLLNVLNPKRDPKGVGVRISQFPEHQEADLWIAGINEVKAVLEANGFKGGEFAMMWPRQLLQAMEYIPMGIDYSKLPQPKPIAPPAPVEQKVPVPTLPAKEFNPDARRAELNGFLPTKVIYTAKRLGIKTKGKETPALIQEILTTEALNAM